MSALPVFYYTVLSPPSRAVCFMAKAIGLKWEHKEINLSKKEHLTPEFVKMNPQHTIPVLNNGGTIIWDSHAIMAYLMAKYSKDDSLYPKDIKLRAVVDQRLHFDSGNTFSLIRRTLRPMIYHNEVSLTERLRSDIHETYALLESFLEGNNWICGPNVTLADFSLIATVTSLDTIVPVEASKYKNMVAWMNRAKQWPYYKDVNERGLEEFRAMSQGLLKKFAA